MTIPGNRTRFEMLEACNQKLRVNDEYREIEREVDALLALGIALIDCHFSVEVESREQLFVEVDDLLRLKLWGRVDS